MNVEEDIGNNNNNNNNNNNSVPDDNIQFKINDQLFLETLLIMVRGEPLNIVYEKKGNMQEEIKLEKDFMEIEENINSNSLNIHINNLNSLEEKKKIVRDKK